MADTTRIEVIPLTPGVREDTDRTTAPLGTLIEAVNARWRRGGIGKANGLTSAGTNTQVGSYGTAYDGLGFANGLQASLMDGRAFVRRAIGDEWKEAGRSSRYLPVKTHWIAFDESSSSIDHYSCAVINTTIAVAYTRFGTTNSAVLVLMDALTGAVRDTAIKTGNIRGGVVAVGSNFAWVYSRDSTGALYRVSVPATSDSIDVSGETQIGTAATLLAANTVFDVASYSSSSFLLAWRVTNTEISVSRVLNSDASLPDFENVTCNNTALSSITVFGTSGEPVWCAFDDGGVNGFKVAKFSANVASTDNAAASFADGVGGYKAGFTRVSSTIARMTWVELTNNSSTPCIKFRSGTVSGNTVTADTSAFHFPPASAPFAAVPHSTNNTTGQYSVWLHTDSGTPFDADARTGAWAVQRKYVLATPSTHNAALPGVVASGSFVPGIELAPDERATLLHSDTVPVVAQRNHSSADGYEGVRYYFPARVVIRTQDAGGLEPSRTLESSALVLYEIEGPASSNTSDARARQIVEVGGRALVLGGHVQELYTQTPNGLRVYTDSGAERQAKLASENGFAFAPAILSAGPTAGSGLTADARYSFCATYEYITPDGQRTQSAPSNIVDVTPSGNNCQATLRISSGPLSERDIVSPPNRVVVHLYSTTGDGNTFQRITPDSSGYLALPGGNGDFVTIVHSAADASVEDNEPLYTDTGEVANQLSPAHRFGWVGGGRLVLAGLFDRTLVEMSKPPRANTPIEFTRLPQFRTQLPEAVTGGAFLDNAHVIFTKSGIYLVQGPYPDDKGAPSLSTPVRLPSVVGCIDHRSVYEIAEGLVFQSARGLELLPRGFGPPRLLSEPMQNALRGRKIISVTAATHGGSVRAGPTTKTGQRMLYMSALAFGGGEDGIRLVYDLDAGRWISTDTPVTSSQGEYLATWDGKLIVAPRALNTLLYEDPEAWIDGTMTITLADARPFNAMGRGYVHRFQLLGEYRAAASVALSVYLDGVYSAPVSLGSLPVTGTAGDKFLLEWQMKGSERKVSAFGARIVVTGNTNSTEDLILHSLAAEVTGLAGRPRVRQNRSG